MTPSIDLAAAVVHVPRLTLRRLVWSRLHARFTRRQLRGVRVNEVDGVARVLCGHWFVAWNVCRGLEQDGLTAEREGRWSREVIVRGWGRAEGRNANR